MSENKKELNEQELETVSGGVHLNSDGTYSFTAGDTLEFGNLKYVVQEDHPNVSGNTPISVTYYELGYLLPPKTFLAEELYSWWVQFADNTSTPIG